MQTDLNLQFIREKIYQIRSALMYSMSNELVKIPTNIVSVLQVDEEGQILFLSEAPLQPVDQCEQSFPSRLTFYRKGVPFFLEVSGKANIVHDEEELIQWGSCNMEKLVLIKMKINDLKFIGLGEKKKKSWLELTLENSYIWLLRNVAFPRSKKSVLQKMYQIN